MSLRPYRALALSLGLAVLGWQIVNLALGHFWHEYLVAVAVASLIVIGSAIVGEDRRATVGMLAGFAIFLGIFLAATTGKLVVGGGHPGTIAAGLGIVPLPAGRGRARPAVGLVGWVIHPGHPPGIDPVPNTHPGQ